MGAHSMKTATTFLHGAQSTTPPTLAKIFDDVRSVCGSWPSGISVAILYDTFERSDLQKNCDLL